jgi:hypothetical protein
MTTTTSDAGTCLMIRGDSREEVEVALRRREEQGYRRQSEPAQVGRTWIVSCAKPGLESKGAEHCELERIGLQVIVRRPTEFAVREKVTNLVTGGAKLVDAIQEMRPGEWTAILDAPR